MSTKLTALRSIIVHIIALAGLSQLCSCNEGEWKWGYEANNGPDIWSSKFETCGGKQQTPVNIDEVQTYPGNFSSPLLLKGYYEQRKKGYEIKNNGHTVEIKFSGQAPSISGGPLNSTYILAGMHFHWASEHTLNGNTYGLEAHLVHYKEEYGSVADAISQPDGLAVVGLLFGTLYYDNIELLAMMKGIKKIRAQGSNSTVHESAMWWLKKYLDTNHYYTYQGSLTTPPCSEVVTWIVLKFPATIGVRQITELQQSMGTDGPMTTTSRPTQPLNDRNIYYHDRDHDKFIDIFF